MHIDYPANNWCFRVPPIGFGPNHTESSASAKSLPRIVSSRPWPRITVPTPGRYVKLSTFPFLGAGSASSKRSSRARKIGISELELRMMAASTA